MNEDSPLVQYIKQLENPNQEGFSIVTNRWYSPSRKELENAIAHFCSVMYGDIDWLYKDEIFANGIIKGTSKAVSLIIK